MDFNFISGVERGLRKVEEGVAERGITLEADRLRAHGREARKTKFEWEVEARGVKVVRAPVGLSRRKRNKSAWKGNTLMWTVEWIPDGADTRTQNVAESKTVAETYVGCYGKKAFSRKRKRDDDDAIPTKEVPEVVNEAAEEGTTQMDSPPATALTPPQSPKPKTATRPPSKPQEPLDSFHFYLHRPQTSSKLKCLIPINPKSTWKEILKGRTLLEFPTVYVRDETEYELPAPFILEQDYLQKHGEDIVVMPQAELESAEPTTNAPETLESSKILEVLKQDLST